MIQRYQSFNQLIGAAKSGFVDMAIVEYRGRDVKCIWGHTMETFVPKEDGFLCLYNEVEFKVFACFAGTKTEIKDIDRIQLINATGHDLHIINNHGDCIRLILAASEGGLIQMQERTLECPDLDGIKTLKKEYAKQGKIPQKQENVYYIVSWIVKTHYPDRTDFLCPDDIVYDEKGKPAGCKTLRR